MLFQLVLKRGSVDGALEHVRRSDPVRLGQVGRKQSFLLVRDTDHRELAGERFPPHAGRLHADGLEPVGHALLALHEASGFPGAVGVDAGADIRETGWLEERAVGEVKLGRDQDAVLAKKLVNKVGLRHEQSPIGVGVAVGETRTVRAGCSRAGQRSPGATGPARPQPSASPAAP